MFKKPFIEEEIEDVETKWEGDWAIDPLFDEISREELENLVVIEREIEDWDAACRK